MKQLSQTIDLGDIVRTLTPAAQRKARGITYLPLRTRTPGKGPPAKLGNGMVAINLADKRLWIGVHGEIVEVRDIDHLMACWIVVLQDNDKPTEPEAA